MLKFADAALEAAVAVGTRFAIAKLIVGGDYHNVGNRDAKIDAVTPAIVLQGKHNGESVSFQVYYGYAVEIRSGNGSKSYGRFAHKRNTTGITWTPSEGSSLTESEAKAMVVLANNAIEASGPDFQAWLIDPATVASVVGERSEDPLRKAFGLKSGLEANSRFQAKRLVNGLPAGKLDEILADRAQAKAEYTASRGDNTVVRGDVGFANDGELPF